MADAPTPGGSGTSLSSLFAGNKRIPRESFYAYLFSSLAVDAVELMGLIGAADVYIAFCRGMYWLNGYKTDKMGVATGVDAVLGVVPVAGALSATLFTVWTYGINVGETNKLGSVAVGVATGRLQKQQEENLLINENASDKKTERPETGQEKAGSIGYQNRGQEQEQGNQNTPEVDGIRQPPVAGGIRPEDRGVVMANDSSVRTDKPVDFGDERKTV
jgi:hypothetical protein